MAEEMSSRLDNLARYVKGMAVNIEGLAADNERVIDYMSSMVDTMTELTAVVGEQANESADIMAALKRLTELTTLLTDVSGRTIDTLRGMAGLSGGLYGTTEAGSAWYR